MENTQVITNKKAELVDPIPEEKQDVIFFKKLCYQIRQISI